VDRALLVWRARGCTGSLHPARCFDNITGQFALPQPGNPNYQDIPDDDPRIAAWQAAILVPAVYQQKIAAGLAITSTATPSLNGTYAVDDGAEILISGIYSGIKGGDGLPGGGASFVVLA
jgi:hypothetical protein